ncbi:MAG: hypothetical protein ABH884_01875, partial [Candidatus Komeilibacteria bacterium]
LPFILLFCMTIPVFAAVPGVGELDKIETGTGLLNHNDPLLLTANIIRMVLGFIGLIFIVLIIWSGIQWLTSNGSPDRITKAKNRIIHSVIGLVILIAAFGISEFVLDAIINAAT